MTKDQLDFVETKQGAFTCCVAVPDTEAGVGGVPTDRVSRCNPSLCCLIQQKNMTV
jgi:hypothetical protein